MKQSLSDAVKLMGEATLAYPWRDPAAYAEWAAQTYYYVRHSTRLLAVAAGRFAQTERGDALHHRFAVHMAEEKRHELLALHDLKTMKRGGLDVYTELPSTRSFYEVQYAKVVMDDPMALFGYILPLEAAMAQHGPAIHAQVVAAFGAPAATFLKVHVEDDPDHVEKALQALAGVSEQQEKAIRASMDQTGFLYAAMMRQMSERSASASPRFSSQPTTASALS